MFKKNNQDINFKDNPSIADIPIHTMKKDLAKLKNPNFDINKENNSSKVEDRSFKTKNKISAKEKTSPFLSQTDWKEKKATDKKPEINTHTQINPNNNIEDSSSNNELIHIKEQPKKEGKKIGIILLILGLILIVIGAGGYYFWKTRINTQISKTTVKVPVQKLAKKEISLAKKSVKTTEKKVVFSVDKPNYLIIDKAETDKTGMKKIIQSYAEKVSQSGITKSVEFVVVDKQNNPLSFQKFAQKMGLTLPSTILMQLKPEFSLFIYNDSGKVRLGLAIKIQNNRQIKKSFLNEEEKLPQDLQSLFLTTQYTLKKKSFFHNGQYKDINIRYNNIISPKVLSIDYAITQNNLVIGTTKETTRAILDLLQQIQLNSKATK